VSVHPSSLGHGVRNTAFDSVITTCPVHGRSRAITGINPTAGLDRVPGRPPHGLPCFTATTAVAVECPLLRHSLVLGCCCSCGGALAAVRLGLCPLCTCAPGLIVAVLSCYPGQRHGIILGSGAVLLPGILQRLGGRKAALPPRLPPTSQHHHLRTVATHEHKWRTHCWAWLLPWHDPVTFLIQCTVPW